MLVVLIIVMVSIIVVTVTSVFTSWLMSPPMCRSIDAVRLAFGFCDPFSSIKNLLRRSVRLKKLPHDKSSSKRVRIRVTHID